MAHSTLLLDAHLKALRLPTFLREYDTVARHCAQEGLDCPRSLFRLCELELLDREQRATERRIKAAKFPVLKSLETFAFRAIPSVNKRLVLELARSAYLDRRENVLALGNSGTGKTHLALALGLAACQKGYRVRFITAAALVNELLEARDEKRLLRVQKQLAKQDLLIVDELGYVPLSKTGAELLFEIFSQRYEQTSTLVTSNLPFNEWTEIFGSERLTGALLDRLSCALGFSWTLDCERVLAGGVSRWGNQIKNRRRRRKPEGRPETPPGAAVGDGCQPGASARRCCVCCAERILSPCRGSWGSRRRGPRSGGISFWPRARPA